jgi:hypothetical protein
MTSIYEELVAEEHVTNMPLKIWTVITLDARRIMLSLRSRYKENVSHDVIAGFKLCEVIPFRIPNPLWNVKFLE